MDSYHIESIESIKPGLRVKVAKLHKTTGLLVAQHYLDDRRLGAIGVVGNWIAGHGGDAWWVRHEDGTIGAYCSCELSVT